jgi:hypothetical protein
MTNDMPSSDELIRRAKQTLRLEKDDFLPKVDEDFAQRGVSIGGVNVSMGDGMPEEMRGETTPIASSGRARPPERVTQPARRRVASSTTDDVVLAPWSASSPPSPVPPSPFHTGSLAGSGRWMRGVGNLLLGFVAVIWVLLLIGLIDNPDDLGETIGGGAVITLVPFLFGLVLREAGKRRGIAA